MTSKRKILLFLAFTSACLVLLFFFNTRHDQTSSGSHAAQAKVEYTCPMHPFIIKDKPGSCPICNMELVRKGTGDDGSKAVDLKDHVYLSPRQQVMANLEVYSIIYKPVFKTIDAAGIINFDQTKQGKISAWAPGRIDRLYANAVGISVSRNHPVAELISPELISAEEEYLEYFLRSRNADKLKKPSDDRFLSQSKYRLRSLGFMDQQFKELEKSATPTVRIPVYSQFNGLIISKDIQQGQYVKAGDTLFGIADLSEVWGELDVYEDEFQYLKIGQQVTILSKSYPLKTFNGRISYIYPFLNQKSRTIRIRVSIPNKNMLLKPEMLISASIQIPLGTDITVPREAVVITGGTSLVWLQAKPGVFVPRVVKTGVRYRNDIQILSGLKKDDIIASNGAYLIDSEAQLKPGGMNPDNLQSSAPDHEKSKNPANMPTAEKPDMNMDMDMGDMKMAPDNSTNTASKPDHKHK